MPPRPVRLKLLTADPVVVAAQTLVEAVVPEVMKGLVEGAVAVPLPTRLRMANDQRITSSPFQLRKLPHGMELPLLMNLIPTN